MKSSITSKMWRLGQPGFKLMMLAAAFGLLAMSSANVAVAANDCVNPRIIPTYSLAYGNNYPEWTAKWWQWAFSLPNVPGNSFLPTSSFKIEMGQYGNVWFLGGPLGYKLERTFVLPYGKALFIAVINAEASDIEDPPFFGITEIKQRYAVRDVIDHITDLFCSIDGHPVDHIEAYRVFSPQYTFIASDKNPLLGNSGVVEGTSVSDGYWIMLAPLSIGQHTIRFGGAVHASKAEGDSFDADAEIDMTYHITVR